MNSVHALALAAVLAATVLTGGAAILGLVTPATLRRRRPGGSRAAVQPAPAAALVERGR